MLLPTPASATFCAVGCYDGTLGKSIKITMSPYSRRIMYNDLGVKGLIKVAEHGGTSLIPALRM